MALTTDPGTSVGVMLTETPATRVFEITPSNTNYLADSNDKPRPARAFMVSTDGVIAVTPVGQSTSVLLTVLAGVIYPIQIKQVLVTGTTVTGSIFGLR